MRRPSALAALLAAVVLASCGGDGGGGSAPEKERAAATPVADGAQPVGEESGGSVAQYADCGDWQEGSRAERFATVRELRGQFTNQDSTTAASPLSDERAVAVFDKTCAQSYAASLRLYKIYVRVQGYAPLAP